MPVSISLRHNDIQSTYAFLFVCLRLCFVFFFKQKTAYEIGLGIPAEPLFRSNPTYQAGLRRDAVQPDIEAERKKRDEIEAGKSYCSRRFGGATCDDKSAQIYARFDKNDWRIQPAE